jgi:hypothetical protein
MTCKWCGDLKTMIWDEAERGCPPPPLGYSVEEEWDRMEASLHYDNNKILLGNEMLKVTVPCPVCVGFGRAKDPPFDFEAASPPAPGVPEALQDKDTPEARWHRTYANLLAFRERMAAVAWAQETHRLALVRQHWLKVAAQREQFRVDNTPDWPAMPDAVLNNGPCPACDNFNFGPTRHPRTGQFAIFCCECAAAWIHPNQPVKNEGEIERHKLEIASLRFNLEHTFLLSPAEAEMLLSRHGFDLLDRLTRQTNNVHYS